MPFQSPQQEAYMYAKHPEIAKRWQEEYGNARGYSEYMKKHNGRKKKYKKSSSILQTISQKFSHLGDQTLSNDLTKIAELIDEESPLSPFEISPGKDTFEDPFSEEPMGEEDIEGLRQQRARDSEQQLTTYCPDCAAKLMDIISSMDDPDARKAIEILKSQKGFCAGEDCTRNIEADEQAQLQLDRDMQDAEIKAEEGSGDWVSGFRHLGDEDQDIEEALGLQSFEDAFGNNLARSNPQAYQGWLQNRMSNMELENKLVKIAAKLKAAGESELAEKVAGVLTTKQRKKAPSAISTKMEKVKPDKGRATKEKHFPIPDIAHARNALSRVEQYDSAPSWWNGTLSALKTHIKNKVYKKYPGLKKRKQSREGKK